MSTTAFWISSVIALLVMLAVIRGLLLRRHRARQRRDLGLSDEEIGRIIAEGKLFMPDDEPLDEDEIARAEAEFWQESWDEPEEYGR